MILEPAPKNIIVFVSLFYFCTYTICDDLIVTSGKVYIQHYSPECTNKCAECISCLINNCKANFLKYFKSCIVYIHFSFLIYFFLHCLFWHIVYLLACYHRQLISRIVWNQKQVMNCVASLPACLHMHVHSSLQTKPRLTHQTIAPHWYYLLPWGNTVRAPI